MHVCFHKKFSQVLAVVLRSEHIGGFTLLEGLFSPRQRKKSIFKGSGAWGEHCVCVCVAVYVYVCMFRPSLIVSIAIGSSMFPHVVLDLS